MCKIMTYINLIKRFNIYQKERFPLSILIFTTGTIILSSYGIIMQELNLIKFLMLLFISLSYLFHIRVNDDIRDFKDDSKFHKKRPVQNKLISLKELKLLDYLFILISTILILLFFSNALIYFGLGLLFIFFAGKDFFIRKYIINKPILYHFLNSIQMIIIMLFIYESIQKIRIDNLLIIHLIFIQLCIFLLEIVRKIKPEKNKKIAYSSYLAFLGHKKIKYLLISIALLMFISFAIILNIIKSNIIFYFVSIVFLIILLCSIQKISDKTNNKHILLTSLAYYIILNLLIFLTAIIK